MNSELLLAEGRTGGTDRRQEQPAGVASMKQKAVREPPQEQEQELTAAQDKVGPGTKALWLKPELKGQLLAVAMPQLKKNTNKKIRKKQQKTFYKGKRTKPKTKLKLKQTPNSRYVCYMFVFQLEALKKICQQGCAVARTSSWPGWRWVAEK